MDLDQARAYIAKVRWQFASSMPKIPHWYTIRNWRPDLNDEYEGFATLILTQGVIRPWPLTPSRDGRVCSICGLSHGWAKTHRPYLDVDHEWSYWVMVDTVEDVRLSHPDPSMVINRARIDEQPTPPTDAPEQQSLF